MHWSCALLFPAVLASQTPFIMTPPPPHEFAFKERDDLFSPRNLIELPRPGDGVANPAGDLVFVPLSKYSFNNSKTVKTIHVAPIKAATASSAAQPLVLKDAGDAFWLDSRTLGHVVSSSKSGEPQQLFAISLKVDGDSVTSNPSVSVGHFPASGLSNFVYSAESATLVFSAYVWRDVNLTSIKEQDKVWESRGTTAMVFDTPYFRHWDTWTGPKKSTLFSVGLNKTSDGKWTLGEEYIAPLKGTDHFTPVEPFGGTDNFDVSSTHIIYTTKDPEVPEAWHTRQNVYIVPLKGGEPPRQLTSGKQGATSSPVLNKQSTLAAWTEMDKDGYEADRAKIVVFDLLKDVRFTLTPEWDRSASKLTFSPSGDSLIYTASEHARIKIFSMPIPVCPPSSDAPLAAPPAPVALTHAHAVGSIQPLANGSVLFTRSSFASPNDVFLLSGLPNAPDQPPPRVEQITRFSAAELAGKALDAGEDCWFEGADGRKVHSWILKPRGWREGGAAARKARSWPVVLLIHGGPQGAWEDQWSTRWNPNVFAQQGYFVIAPNPTGSTGFGQEFTDRIAENWGGRPFVDLIEGWKEALRLYPEIDPDRAVAAGASWGGYAINWIQGHPEFGFGFKALVNHDGVFDTKYNGFSTDELFFFNHDFGGPPFTEKGTAISEKWNPSNFVHKWSTPQLLIHGSRDYRLPETESLGAFNALQQLGIDSRLIIFPDENHWVLNPENSLKWHHEVFRWFSRHLE